MGVNSSDITPKWNDIRTEFGHNELYEIASPHKKIFKC